MKRVDINNLKRKTSCLSARCKTMGKNSKINASMSTEAYLSKDAVTIAINGSIEQRREMGVKSISFKEYTLTVEDFALKLIHGYTYCNLFSGYPKEENKKTYEKADGSFTLCAKSDRFFNGSYTINIDIDHTNYQSPRDFIKTLSIPPTIFHTTFSNQQLNEDGTSNARFRLIYVFDEKIKGKLFYRYCANSLYNIVEHDTKEVIEDKCGLNCTQYFNGTNINNEKLDVDYNVTDFIYSIKDIGISKNKYIEYLQNNAGYKNSDHKKEIELELNSLGIETEVDIGSGTLSSTQIDFDDDLVNDAERLPYDEFHNIYKHRYRYFYRIEEDDKWEEVEDYKIQIIDKDRYLQLPYIAQKRKDGQHRRNTLFHRAWLRRLIYHDVSPNEILYNLIVDRERFFDNRDGVLNITTLKNKVIQSFEYPIEHYVETYSDVYGNVLENSRKRSFILHWSNCYKEKHISLNHISKVIRWKILDTVYDVSLSINENLKIMIDSDIMIKIKALRSYCHERGIDTNPNKDERYKTFEFLHVAGMSLRKEAEYLKDKGLEISLTTLRTYKDRYIRNRCTEKVHSAICIQQHNNNILYQNRN